MDWCRFDAGLVPTAPLLAFLQWGGRTHFVLAVVRQIPEVRSFDGLINDQRASTLLGFITWELI